MRWTPAKPIIFVQKGGCKARQAFRVDFTVRTTASWLVAKDRVHGLLCAPELASVLYEDFSRLFTHLIGNRGRCSFW